MNGRWKQDAASHCMTMNLSVGSTAGTPMILRLCTGGDADGRRSDRRTAGRHLYSTLVDAFVLPGTLQTSAVTLSGARRFALLLGHAFPVHGVVGCGVGGCLQRLALKAELSHPGLHRLLQLKHPGVIHAELHTDWWRVVTQGCLGPPRWVGVKKAPSILASPGRAELVLCIHAFTAPARVTESWSPATSLLPPAAHKGSSRPSFKSHHAQPVGQAEEVHVVGAGGAFRSGHGVRQRGQRRRAQVVGV